MSYKKFIVLFSLLVLSLNFVFSQKLLLGDDKVVKVNNTIITLKELKNNHEQLKNYAVMSGQNPPSEKEVLQVMIDNKLLESEIKNSSIVLNEAAYNQQVQMFQAQYTQYMQQNNPNFQFSEQNFKDYVARQGKISYQEFIENIKTQVKGQQYIQKRAQEKLGKVMKKVYSDTDLKKIRQKYLNEFVVPESIDLKHIFFRTIDGAGKTFPDSEKKIARKKADDVLKRLKSGENFDQLCELHSEDIESRDQKNPKTGKLDRGYLGDIPISGKLADMAKNQFGNTIYQKLFTYKKNSYTEVLESQYGYHIFFIRNKLPERIIPYQEAKPQLINFMRRMDQQKVIMETQKAIIDELRKKADIKYFKNEYK